ncbi:MULTISPECIES: alpha/beta hydrolase-fold protein [unclassified Rhodanobacter]|uniref:alpha/beta hydrolase n=1 Tax=unclassified Rhodanobacter TaxID=2621553 RepID=UPI002106C43C|nr:MULTISPECIES: alpha/beta hydrolase-fold protein [unclassified Rhodanobacter]
MLASALALRWHAGVTPPIFKVELDGAATQPVSGRLLLFATEATAARKAAKNGKVESVDADPLYPMRTAVASREVSRLAPRQSVTIDTDNQAFPRSFSSLPPGEYLLQAVLDLDHNYNYSGRSAGDLVSPVISVHLPAITPSTLRLVRVQSEPYPWQMTSAPDLQAAAPDARAHTKPIDRVSTVLSAFWGRPIHMRGWVLTPPGYETSGNAHFPTVYYTHGFGGSEERLINTLVGVHLDMVKGQMPPMIWVFLDESGPTGTHEFADSVNNGPWGKALTTELIPALESHYRMDAKASGRFLTGHSSGGWATLWLQINYPKLFGGTWSTSPDPVDFHDFSGVNLYAPHANVYRRPDGTLWPLERLNGKVQGTFEDSVRLERVLGAYGGQMSSYEWVFSPRNDDGRPALLFDRDTGTVDPAVAAYWRDHYDIAHRLQADWPKLEPDLEGKIHVMVGTADTYYLDGAVHRLQAVLDGLHAKTDFRYLPGKTHADLYMHGDDPRALLKQISWEMYAQARPDSSIKAPAQALMVAPASTVAQHVD